MGKLKRVSEKYYCFDEAEFLEKLGLDDPKTLNVTKVEVKEGISVVSYRDYREILVWVNELEEEYYITLSQKVIAKEED